MFHLQKNWEIALVVLYVSVDIKPFIEKGEFKVCVYKSKRQSCVSYKREETIFLLISDNITIEEEFINMADVGVNFYKSQNLTLTPLKNSRMDL